MTWSWKSRLKAANGCANGFKPSSKPKSSNTARFFPQSKRKAHHRRRQKMSLRTAFGPVELSVWRGKNPADGRWSIPIRQRWGLSPHQQLSPALADKLAFFATVTGSYELAAQTARKVGVEIEDSTVREVVQRLGSRAEEKTQQRLKTVPVEVSPARCKPSALGIVMLDGFHVRHRGRGWGRKKTKHPRVEWHEQKVGVFYCAEHNGGGEITEKVVVSVQGEPVEIGERLHWQAVRAGMGRAQELLAVGDGAPWIWNLISARWSQAHQLLDFYHASQHLHALGEALYPRDEGERGKWIGTQCHRLRHGHHRVVLRRIAALPESSGADGEVVRREKNYFTSHASRVNYREAAERGWPIGSGAVESACAQKQGRFKRPGQFWTAKGLANLNALIEARDSGCWDELWLDA